MFLKAFSSNFKHLFLRNIECRFCNHRHTNSIFTPKLNPQIKRTFAQIPSVQIPLQYTNKTKAGIQDQQHLHAQNDPELFGTDQTVHHVSDDVTDEGDEEEDNYLTNPPKTSQKLRTKEYADMIKDHLQNNRIREAIDVLEIRMIKEDRVKPVNYIFNLLIGGCARVGYSKKAFLLYNKMKQRNLKITGGTYTSLFNACAMAPWPQDGLNKANRLREIMLEKHYEPNESNYNAMIKAYGRCGDIQMAFQLVDEMQEKQLQIDVKTINFLLQACVSDKEFGFRHALLVWHKMLSRKLVPDVYSFNLLLRCVRDCSIGDLDATEEVIGQILLQSKRRSQHKLEEPIQLSGDALRIAEPSDSSNREPEVNGKSEDSTFVTTSTQIEDMESSATPNLIAKLPHLGSLVSLSEIKRPEDRLLLIGGANGVLREMAENHVEPTIKTFTELLEVIPSTFSAEKSLIASVRKNRVKCDIDFFNVLMKKRSIRFDYDGAKAVLPLVQMAALQPDIITYGVLAMGCRTADDARTLLQEMYDKGLRMNIQILGAMLKQGCCTYNFNYVQEIMNIVKTERIKPNEQFLTHLYEFERHCARKNANSRNTKNPSETDNFVEEFRTFKYKLTNWRRFMGLNNLKKDEAINIVREHPWEQFKSTQPDGVEEIKNPKSRLKKKLQRHIQKIKPDRMTDTSDTAMDRQFKKVTQD